MTNRLFSGIDSLPLSGKFITKAVVMDYVEAGKETDRKKFATAIGALGILAVGHALQTKMGIDAIGHNIDHASSSGEGLNIGLSTLEVAYAGINAAVTLREIDLMKRMVEIRKKKQLSYADDDGGMDKTPDHRKGSNIFRNQRPLAIGAAAAVTLAGQAAGLAAMNVSSDYQYDSPVIEHAINSFAVHSHDIYPDEAEQVSATNYQSKELATKIPTETRSIDVTR